MPRSNAVCLLSLPLTTNERICRSRGLSVSKRSCRIANSECSCDARWQIASAFSISLTSSFSLNGFVKKPVAPVFTARTAIGMFPCPVMKMMQRNPSSQQGRLQFQSVQTRQVDVQHDAAQLRNDSLVEKFFSCRERNGVVAIDQEQSLERLPHGRIVIHDKNR